MKYIDAHKKINTITKPVAKKNSKGSFKGIATLALILLIFVAVGGTVLLFKSKLNPVSIVASATKANIKETDGRTNILVLGSDKRDNGNAVTSVLTDTILLVSIGRVEHDVLLLSMPRDLYVENSKGYSTKINAVYTLEGPEELQSVVEDVLGVPIHYYAVVDFNLFVNAINVLGGIDVNVQNAFTDYQYPIEGKENAPIEERYETISFAAGKQHMDGETALKFARSRKGDNNEGTDFARAARQQLVIEAIKEKALSLKTVTNASKIKELYDLYAEGIDTNLGFADVQGFYLLSQQINFDSIRSIVLDDRSEADKGGLLYAPIDTALYGNQYVLIPQSGDYSQIHAYVQRYLFGE